MRNERTGYNARIMKMASAIGVSLLFVLIGVAYGVMPDPSHLDKRKVSGGCAACHKGRGSPGTPLLRSSLGKICFNCHGTHRKEMSKTDIERVFRKASRHPIFATSQYHWFGEVLPEDSATVPRHVSCFDCHVVHASEEEKPWKNSKGYAPVLVRGRIGGGPPMGRRFKEAEEMYQLCYLCHSDSANRPTDQDNVSVEFDPDNESYHPVELPGNNSFVPSLVRRLSVTSYISCIDCHGNDDPRGPQGPHGSDHAPILVAQYTTDEGREGPRTYELCYMCHDRRSILGDESFQRHLLHIVSVRTSCYTCHDAHGSEDNRHLINFNDEVVEPSITDGGPSYVTGLTGRPKCYLNCHDTDHNSGGVGDNSWPW